MFCLLSFLIYNVFCLSLWVRAAFYGLGGTSITKTTFFYDFSLTSLLVFTLFHMEIRKCSSHNEFFPVYDNAYKTTLYPTVSFLFFPLLQHIPRGARTMWTHFLHTFSVCPFLFSISLSMLSILSSCSALPGVEKTENQHIWILGVH